MAISGSRMSIDPGLEAHYADIGKAVVEAAVAQGKQPDDKGELDIAVKLNLDVGESIEGLRSVKPKLQVCCLCVIAGVTRICYGDRCR